MLLRRLLLALLCALARCRDDFVITIIAYNRPTYFETVLASLARCAGIEKYLLLVFLEPGDARVLALARGFDAAKRTEVVVNARRLGAHPNLRQAVAAGFERAGRGADDDFVIVLEDDTPLAPDALAWFEWARRAYAADAARVFSVSAFADNCHDAGDACSALFAREPALARAAARRAHYSPWAWGMWRDRWRGVEAGGWRGRDAEMNFAAVGAAADDGCAARARIKGGRGSRKHSGG